MKVEHAASLTMPAFHYYEGGSKDIEITPALHDDWMPEAMDAFARDHGMPRPFIVRIQSQEYMAASLLVFGEDEANAVERVMEAINEYGKSADNDAMGYGRYEQIKKKLDNGDYTVYVAPYNPEQITCVQHASNYGVF